MPAAVAPQRTQFAKLFAAALLASGPAAAQYQPPDGPAQITLNSATPQRQWVGDTMQMYEPAATVIAGCPYKTLGYYCGVTNAESITSPPDGTHAPGVWGHDEGPSTKWPPHPAITALSFTGATR